MRTKTIRLKRWKVEVLPEAGEESRAYYVVAADPMDARIMAFMISSGLTTEGVLALSSNSSADDYDEDYVEGLVEIVKQYTRILEESNA